MKNDAKKDLFCVTAIFLAAFLFLCGVFLTGRVLIPADVLQFEAPWRTSASRAATYHNTLISDAVVQSYPWRLQSMRSLHQGVVPLWNPYQFSGTPHAANTQSAVFYPVSLAVFFIFGVAHGLGVNALIHLWLAGAGLFLLMRHFGAGRIAGLFSAFALIFGGWFVSWLSRPEFVETAAWLPWLFLFFSTAFRRNKISTAVAGGVVFGAQILAGHLQMMAYSAIALGLFALYLAAFGNAYYYPRDEHKMPFWENASRAIGFYLTIILVGSLVGAVQLWQSYELFSLAPRMAEAARGAIRVKGFFSAFFPYINILMPDFFGNPLYKNIRGGYNYAEMCAYCGIITIPLALLAAARFRRGPVVFFSFLAVLSLLFAAGTPVYLLVLKIIPLLRAFNSGRFALIFCFSVSILAGFGIEYLLNRDTATRKLATSLSMVFALIAAAAFLLVYTNLNARPALFQAGLWPLESSSIIRFSVLLLVSFLFIAARAWAGKSTAVVLCMSLLLADLFVFGARFNTAADPALLFPPSNLVDTIKKDRSEKFRIHAFSRGHIFILNSATVLQLEDVRGYDSIYYKRYQDLVRVFQEKHHAGSFVQGPWLSFTAFSPNLLKMLNVKYVMAEFDVSAYRPELEPMGRIDDVWLYRYRNYLPRAWIVKNVAVEKDDGRTLAALIDDRFDPRETAILGGKPEFCGIETSFAGNTDYVHVSLDSPPGELHMEANLTKPAVIMISEVDYPGWEIRVDGKKVSFVRADYVLRAVALNRGRHIIDFIFSPLSARFGIFISIAAAALSALILAASALKRNV